MNNDPHEIQGCVFLMDEPNVIMKKFKRAITDSDTENCVRYDRENKPGVANLMNIYATITGKSFGEIEREFEGEIKRVARESGDRAVTHYEVVRQYADYALLKVQIETGRTHQIRVHMSYIGHPLLGDSLYGNGPIEGLDRAALHAGFMQFYQPFNGNSIRIGVKLPPDMDRFVRESPLDITPYTW